MRKRTPQKRKRKLSGAAEIAARRRDMQRIRDSVRGLESNLSFVGRIDPRLRQTAADGIAALAELTRQAPTDVLQKLEPTPKKRGRKQDPSTPARILLAARCKAEGMTQYKMARQLFPGLTQAAAYNLTRPFLSQNKSAIDAAAARIDPRKS